MKKLTIFCLSLIIFLAACANEGKNSKEIKMGKYLKENDTVAYTIEPSSDGQYNKNEIIEAIHFIKNGKIKTYRVHYYNSDDKSYIEEISLGEVSKMSDKELLSYAKKADKKIFKEIQSKIIEELENSLSDDDKYIHPQDEERKNYEKALNITKNLKYKEPKYKKIDLKGEEDGTGNNISEEYINIDYQFIDVDTTRKDDVAILEEANREGEDTFNIGSNYSTEVYDKKYAGWFKQIDYDDSTEIDRGLIIEVGDKTEELKLDDKEDVRLD